MATVHAHTLPIWVWLLFTTLLVGVITFIYSEGKWRTTLTSAAITGCLILAAAGIEIWINFLHIHFMGRYDSLGIPFREAGPGWSMLLDAWPLWLIPMGLMALLLFAIDWLIRRFFTSKNVPSTLAEPPIIKNDGSEPLQNIAKKIEFEAHKRELADLQHRLAEAIEIAETQLDKKQLLEATVEQLKTDQNKKTAELENKIAAILSEMEAYQTQKEELTTLTVDQAEEILRLKTTGSK